ncbi:MAG: LPS export ABC transporter permease LptF [bacterium]|nr:LPS export ABC transporter permease LptF [bacterium]
MPVLTRYILKEHIAPFVYSLALIIFIFVLNLLFQMLGRIVGKGLEWMVILEFFALNLAWIASLAIPMAVLVSVLMAFARLSADQEITALRAAGVSLFRLLRPVLLAGFACTLFLVYFNGWLLPNFNYRLKELNNAISRKRPILAIEPGVFNFDLGNYVMLADSVRQRDNLLMSLLIQDEGERDKKVTIRADRGTLKFSPSARAFLFTMGDGEIHRFKWKVPLNYEVIQFDSAIVKLPAPGALFERTEQAYRSDREMTIPMMFQRIAVMKKNREDKDRLWNSLQVELHKKFSIPVACILFVLIAVPLGARLQRSGIGLSAGLSTFFFLIYWVFLISGEDYADRGKVAPWLSMWLPNLLMLGIGVFLMVTTVKQGTQLNLIPSRWRKQKEEDPATLLGFDRETAERLLNAKNSGLLEQALDDADKADEKKSEERL